MYIVIAVIAVDRNVLALVGNVVIAVAGVDCNFIGVVVKSVVACAAVNRDGFAIIIDGSSAVSNKTFGSKPNRKNCAVYRNIGATIGNVIIACAAANRSIVAAVAHH